MKIGKMEEIKTCQVEIEEISKKDFSCLVEFGKKVASDDDYFQIAFIRAIKNGINADKIKLKKNRKKISQK